MTTLTAPPPTRACPKCSHESPATVTECPRCHVIIDKAIKARAVEAVEAEASHGQPSGWQPALSAAEHLSVKQHVERLEAWTGIETANTYVVKDGRGDVLFHAIEESGSAKDFVVRNFLKAARPFTMRLDTPHGETALVIRRPFRWFFSEVEITDAFGKRVGHVQRQFSLLNSRYTLTGRQSSEEYEIFGPFLRPWTFKIRRQGQESGLISKKWSGLGKELFTDADAFGIEFPAGITPELKAVFLGAVFLIDFAHFEDNNGD